MKHWVHHYTLQPGPDPVRAARAPRHGALLKVEFDDRSVGYADLHPWTEFGHAPLDVHLASLASGQPTTLANTALRHARTDAAARRAGLSLFDGLPPARSHALFTGWTAAPCAAFGRCAAEGFESVKLKVGKSPAHEAGALDALADFPLRWRLDANASFTTVESVCGFLAKLSPQIRRNIEFIEDPCPYDSTAWSALSEKEKIPLALDWEIPSSAARTTLPHPPATGPSRTAVPATPPWPGAQLVIIKPASQDAFPLALAAAHAGMEIVVTHSMDHPLGRAVALWTSMRLRQRHGDIVRDGGLQGAALYQPDEFSAQLEETGPETAPPTGTGFGFDPLLQALQWREHGS